MKTSKLNLSIFALAVMLFSFGCTTVTVTNSSSGDEAVQRHSEPEVKRKSDSDIVVEELRAAVETIKGMKLQSLHIEATGHKSTGFNSDRPLPTAATDGGMDTIAPPPPLPQMLDIPYGGNTGEKVKIFVEGMGEVEGELVKDLDEYEED